MMQSAQHFDGYDIIGDVHGCAGALRYLLEKLGYQDSAEGYRYKDLSRPRQVIFVGDLIDRGSDVANTLSIVKAMWDQGQAQVVMGNHELAAIAWHTPYQQGFVRQHNERSYRQLKATLEQFEDAPQALAAYIEWFRQLPLFLDMPDFRVVHACWDQAMIDSYLAQYASPKLADEILFGAPEVGSFAQRFLERLTRGISLSLPEGMHMMSHEGFPRYRFRVKFWSNRGQSYNDILFQPDPLPQDVGEQPISMEERAQLLDYSVNEKPLFTGHYWLRGEPSLLQSNVACLDYSAVNQGLLVAYRIQSGERQLQDDRFVYVSCKDE